MNQDTLIFKPAELNGHYGIIFHGEEPIAACTIKKEDFSLIVAFKKGKSKDYTKGEIVLSVFDTTNDFYGMHEYYVAENNDVFNAYVSRFDELNS